MKKIVFETERLTGRASLPIAEWIPASIKTNALFLPGLLRHTWCRSLAHSVCTHIQPQAVPLRAAHTDRRGSQKVVDPQRSNPTGRGRGRPGGYVHGRATPASPRPGTGAEERPPRSSPPVWRAPQPQFKLASASTCASPPPVPTPLPARLIASEAVARGVRSLESGVWSLEGAAFARRRSKTGRPSPLCWGRGGLQCSTAHGRVIGDSPRLRLREPRKKPQA